MGETLADLFREAGIGTSAASRAAREGAPPPLRPPPNNPAARRVNERRRLDPAQAAYAQRTQAFQPPRNQIAELPAIAAEMTPFPSAIRARQAWSQGDDQGGNFEAMMAGLNWAGLAAGAGPRSVPRPLPRSAFEGFGTRLPPIDRAAAMRGNGNDAGDAGGGQFGPSLQDLVDDGMFEPGQGAGGLVLGALRRNRIDLRRLEDSGLVEQPMPRRSLPVSAIRRTDHTPPEKHWVDQYVQNPQHEPIIVRQNRRGGYDIIDGHHRLAAAQARGETNIDVYDASLYFDKNPRSPALPDGGAGGGGQFADLYRGSRHADLPRGRGVWVTPDRAAADAYSRGGHASIYPHRQGSNVMPMRGRIDQAVAIESEADLRAALGERARVIDDVRADDAYEMDLLEVLDDPRIQAALRESDVGVVRVNDASPAGGAHQSYLFLDENLLQSKFAPERLNGGASTPPRPPPGGPKSYRSNKPPPGGFSFGAH